MFFLRFIFLANFFVIGTFSWAVSSKHQNLIIELQNRISWERGKLEAIVEENKMAGDLNKQELGFKDISEQVFRELQSNWFKQIIISEPNLASYYNLTVNHLLHISLSNKIEAASNIDLMYPHELPFRHSGAYPSQASWEVLGKVKDFLDVVLEQRKLIPPDFGELRLKQALSFVNEIGDLNPEERLKLTNLVKGHFSEESFSENNFQSFLSHRLSQDKELVQILLEAEENSIYQKEKDLLETLTNNPLGLYQNFKSRLSAEGYDANFPEFKSVLETLYNAILLSPGVEAALTKEPRLLLLRNRHLKNLQEIFQSNHFSYQEVWSQVFHCSEFLDVVQRILYPEKSNPLHYAKRYEYYAFYAMGLAPKQIFIPTSASLSTYSLLSISGVPVGLGGVSTNILWVDSYAQTPNEFLLHDIANHERRRYQFTRNYAKRLGIPDDKIDKLILALDERLHSDILPLIKRIDKNSAENLYRIESGEAQTEAFLALVPGKEYFKQEIKEMELELSKTDDTLSVLTKYRLIINRKKALFDMILFEVVHEDAMPPSRKLIVESILRPPNTPMPRDFIDVGSRTAYHTMEPAGTTMAYILQKVNGSFYDTPKKRLLVMLSEEYRTPKKIIESTAQLIQQLGGYEGLSYEDILKKVVFLTATEEGFLSYLVDEFQRDLHPIQKSLLSNLKYAESLEVLSLIDTFNPDAIFDKYLAEIRARIQIALDLSIESSQEEADKINLIFSERNASLGLDFEALQDQYFKLGKDVVDRLFYDQIENQQKTNSYTQPIRFLKAKLVSSELARKELIADWGNSNASSQFEKMETLSLEIEKLKRELLSREQIDTLNSFIKRNKAKWEKTQFNSIPVDSLVLAQAKSLHNQSWLPNFRMSFGTKAAYRDVPESAFLPGESSEEAYSRLLANGKIGLVINTQGRLQQNINLDSHRLVPELFESLTIKSARQYIDLVFDAIRSGNKLSPELIDSLAVSAHDVWMKNNTSKIATAFTKLGLNVFDLPISKILEIVSSLSLSDWKKMDIYEVMALKQFVPSEKLSSREKRNDRGVILSVIEQISREMQISNFIESNKAFWGGHASPYDNGYSKLSRGLAKFMHDKIWKREFRLSSKNKERWKDLPLEVLLPGESNREALRRLRLSSYSSLRIGPKHVLQQNINIDAKKIVPELFDQLSLQLSEKYIAAVLQDNFLKKELNKDLLLEMSEKIHQVWMENNLWQISPIFTKIGTSIEGKSIPEILNKVENLEKANWLSLEDSEIEKLRQYVDTKKLDWSEHKKNMQIAMKIIEELGLSKTKVRPPTCPYIFVN